MRMVPLLVLGMALALFGGEEQDAKVRVYKSPAIIYGVAEDGSEFLLKNLANEQLVELNTALQDHVAETGGPLSTYGELNKKVSFLEIQIKQEETGFVAYTTILFLTPPTKELEKELYDALSAQYPDGWGESLEQHDFLLQGVAQNFTVHISLYGEGFWIAKVE